MTLLDKEEEGSERGERLSAAVGSLLLRCFGDFASLRMSDFFDFCDFDDFEDEEIVRGDEGGEKVSPFSAFSCCGLLTSLEIDLNHAFKSTSLNAAS